MTQSNVFVTRPALYVVATPIGNLGDFSQRAIETLRAVDVIAAEDTRHSARLMQHFAINTRMISYHDFSTGGREDAILSALDSGQAIALISDAGTPLISDPGYSLVVKARAAGVPVIPVPGACALTAAVSVSGLPSDRFAFEGFPPHKQAARLQLFEALATETRTLIFYESPHRILDCLQNMRQAFGAERQAVIGRELTKTWETVHGDTLAGLCEWLQESDNNRRGEFVVMVKGADKKAELDINPEAEKALLILMRELPLKQAAALAAEISGSKKNSLYKRALELASTAELKSGGSS
jgi:16S rRNA (cytidine1402-2'-O)-methyltransferase